ncbi:hypothetical protein RHVP.31 [Cricetid gammaherpesvirus 2]|uniref:Uncharacterized protein n=1 Tax=Cricetid gammaherpesvirus 2 TaxID=1605972 RepID=E9M5L4_9GAMA|nr:hypothetical protein RHVP.31 [Cricetid gammaherpesvirus 2]ADW24372.1 hypothetical protein RHVP.31 [Cricetid gammaherpesvirus 2]ADW24454.1 hypothetical protein RHVP-L.31 [Cricetid gammaherpesvirus 2]
MCEGRGNGNPCRMNQVQTPLCTFYNLQTIFRCMDCSNYHICNGGKDCDPLISSEGVVCAKTGKFIRLDMKFSTIYNKEVADHHGQDQQAENEATLNSLYEDIVNILLQVDDIEEVKTAVICDKELAKSVKQQIASTFSECVQVIRENEQGYSIVCSMYVHVIISMYATKTIYGNLLFKCTRNKKHDAIAKKIREKWMLMQ